MLKVEFFINKSEIFYIQTVVLYIFNFFPEIFSKYDLMIIYKTLEINHYFFKNYLSFFLRKKSLNSLKNLLILHFIQVLLFILFHENFQ